MNKYIIALRTAGIPPVQVHAHRYTRGALIITSNLEFADWTSVFNDDARLVAALLDRLTHRCHLLQFRGESYRFRESLAARESAPSPAPAAPRRRNSTPPVDPTEGAHITT